VRTEALRSARPRHRQDQRHVISAVSSVRTFGVLSRYAARIARDVDIVDAIAEIGDQSQACIGVLRRSSVISSVTVGTRTSADRTASAISLPCQRRVVEIERASNSSACGSIRVRQLAVTTTRGFS